MGIEVNEKWKKRYKRQFKAENRFLNLSNAISEVLASPESDEYKLNLLSLISHAAQESVCLHCGERVTAHNLCKKHYQIKRNEEKQQQLKNSQVDAPFPNNCLLDYCEEEHSTRGLCQIHYIRIFKQGVDPHDLRMRLDKIPKDNNPIGKEKGVIARKLQSKIAKKERAELVKRYDYLVNLQNEKRKHDTAQAIKSYLEILKQHPIYLWLHAEIMEDYQIQLL